MVSGGGVWRGFLKGFLEGVSGGGFWRGVLACSRTRSRAVVRVLSERVQDLSCVG